MTAEEIFAAERKERISQYQSDTAFQALSRQWLQESMARKYVYNFDWMGRPIIQYPQDMAAVQELIWKVRPDLVIETGIAHGGSLILSASMLALLDISDAIEAGTIMNPRNSSRKVIGIDIDIRPHNHAAIEAHPMASRIQMFQGSSIDPHLVEQIEQAAHGYQTVMVFLDSMHSHAHVLSELQAYAHMVTTGSYCVVFDTYVEDLPAMFFPDRPWDVGDNPKTAVYEWLKGNRGFSIDRDIEARLMVTVSPSGFLRRDS